MPILIVSSAFAAIDATRLPATNAVAAMLEMSLFIEFPFEKNCEQES
jgi:hypothetical protein